MLDEFQTQTILWKILERASFDIGLAAGLIRKWGATLDALESEIPAAEGIKREQLESRRDSILEEILDVEPHTATTYFEGDLFFEIRAFLGFTPSAFAPTLRRDLETVREFLRLHDSALTSANNGRGRECRRASNRSPWPSEGHGTAPVLDQ
jgi:hypothetical protein